MALPPPTLSKAAGGCRGQMAAGDTGPVTACPRAPGGPSGKPGEGGCGHTLTFPVKIIVWDANIDEALEDLQGEQRRAAGGGPVPCTGLTVPESAHEHGRQLGARPHHPGSLGVTILFVFLPSNLLIPDFLRKTSLMASPCQVPLA